jgi:4'-phosphopantetheinyl transferase
VDIESSNRASVMPELAERVCHPHEMAELRLLAEPARSEALLALWVRKEAYLKAAGIGLQREMGTFAAPRDALLELPGGELTRVRMLEAGPHWVAAVAGAPEVPIASRWLRICTTGTE